MRYTETIPDSGYLRCFRRNVTGVYLEKEAVSAEPTPQETTVQAPKQRASVHERRLNRQQSKPNKAQVKAAQSRAAQSALAPSADVAPASEVAVAAPGESPVKLTAAQRRALERGGTAARGTGMPVGTLHLSRAQEMEMIREDLHRLLIIAGALLAGMLVLLFFID